MKSFLEWSAYQKQGQREVMWDECGFASVMRKELWDRQGANMSLEGNHVYGEKLFPRPKRDFGERSTLFRRSFIANGLGECW